LTTVASLKDLRAHYSITQVKLADLSGITQVYLSTIENNKMPMTRDVSKKIYDGFIRAVGDFPFDYKAYDYLRASHTASSFKQELQYFVYDLLSEMYTRETIFEFIKEHQKIPDYEECPVIIDYLAYKEMDSNVDKNDDG